MVSGRAKRVAWSQDVAEASVSGVRRVDLNAQVLPVKISSVPPPSALDTTALELAQARAELAATRAELADTKAELARLRATREVPQQPVPVAPEPELELDLEDLEPEPEPEPEPKPEPEPEPGRTAHSTTLQNVVVTEATSLPDDVAVSRRDAARYPCQFEVEFAHDTHFIAGISSDMSTGGLFVATYRSLPVGSPVTLAFDLPSGHRVEARGEVRWARETEHGDSRPGLGIAFTDLSATALAHIVEYCRGRPPLCFEV
jgi:uncharacterized protein (TIGR02266 family)